MAPQRIDIGSLSLPELQELHRNLSAEVENLTNNLVVLQQTAGRFGNAGKSIEELKEKKPGQPLLLPMTESLYVSGTIDNIDTVLLEIGTGYFIEKDVDGGVEYCRRKVMLIKDQIEQLSQVIQQQHGALSQIQAIAQEKAAAAGATGAATGNG